MDQLQEWMLSGWEFKALFQPHCARWLVVLKKDDERFLGVSGFDFNDAVDTLVKGVRERYGQNS